MLMFGCIGTLLLNNSLSKYGVILRFPKDIQTHGHSQASPDLHVRHSCLLVARRSDIWMFLSSSSSIFISPRYIPSIISHSIQS
jgi:hypothetical protein